MTMRRIRSCRLVALVAVALAASCGSGGSTSIVAKPKTNLENFVRKLISQTSDRTEPVSIDDKAFTFSEDPHAYDDLFQK